MELAGLPISLSVNVLHNQRCPALSPIVDTIGNRERPLSGTNRERDFAVGNRFSQSGNVISQFQGVPGTPGIQLEKFLSWYVGCISPVGL